MHRAFSANIFLRRSPWGAAPGSGVNGAPLALNRYRFTAGAIRRDEHLRKNRGLSRLMCGVGALTFLLLLAGWGNRGKGGSGTIDVDEGQVGRRAGGRVEKI